jgi:hypothetical protein
MEYFLSIKSIIMIQNKKRPLASETIILLIVLANVIVIEEGFITSENWYRALVFTLPLLLLAIGSTCLRRKPG